MTTNHGKLTEQQQALLEVMIPILEKELKPRVAELDKTGEYPMDVAQKLFEAGLYGLNVPEKFGGMGCDARTMAILKEEAARIDAGFAFTFFGGTGIMELLMTGASEEMQAYVAKKILEEHCYVSFAMTEAEAGSDAVAMRTTYVKEGDEYIINGTKTFISHSAIADIVIVAATKDRSLKHKGISFFMVEKKDGFKVGKHEDKMGLRLSPTAEVIFEDVHIPAKNLVGEEGKGFAYSMKILEKERPINTSFAVGIAQNALDIAVAYANERQTFGVPVIQHQGLSFLLAEMQAKVHAARAMVRMGCKFADEGTPLNALSPTTKFFVTELCMQVTIDAVQVLGGYGYMRDYPVEKLMRDVKIFSIFEGTNQINRQVAAGFLSH